MLHFQEKVLRKSPRRKSLLSRPKRDAWTRMYLQLEVGQVFTWFVDDHRHSPRCLSNHQVRLQKPVLEPSLEQRQSTSVRNKKAI